jgi:hypothetical protein
MWRKKTLLVVVACAGLAVAAVWFLHRGQPAPEFVIDVYPGEDIQAALDAAASQPGKRVVKVHAGVYRPARPGQALIYFNARHDGVTLEGVGDVILTGANPELADRTADSFPAVVNHVIYFGDLVSEETVLRGVRVTGANGFVDGPPGLIRINSVEDLNRSTRFQAFESPIESNDALMKTHEFYCDGGGILVYGRSYPTIEGVEVYGNRSAVCGGGVSVQHQKGAYTRSVRFKDCVFRDNRAPVSGAAIDVFAPGSRIELENCLFVGNLSEERVDITRGHGSGALSIFPGSTALVSRCTFTDNGSAVDDRGPGSTYEDSIFWKNTRAGGVATRSRFELNLKAPAAVSRCFVHGAANDLESTVPRVTNRFDPPDPDFDADYRPRNPLYDGVGYRPVR